MPRPLLDESALHPAIRPLVERWHASLVDEVRQAVASHDVVVVGMRQNPFCAKARKALEASATPFRYLEYGSYFSMWRPRTALKMWTGWPTFPMVFVRGTLIGGASELQSLIDSGELQRLLATGTPAP